MLTIAINEHIYNDVFFTKIVHEFCSSVLRSICVHERSAGDVDMGAHGVREGDAA